MRNVDDAVSVNHNWFNGCNIEFVARKLLSHFEDVEREISDCQDMDDYLGHCQLMLKSSFGMDFQDLLDILQHILRKRLEALHGSFKIEIFDGLFLGRQHILNDISMISKVFGVFSTSSAINRYETLAKSIEKSQTEIKSAKPGA